MINDEMAGEEESSASSVPQVDEVVDGGEDEEEEFEITGEGTASTGQGLKKIFFVKQKNPSSASDEEKVPPQSRMKGMFKKFTDSAATEMKRLKNVNLPSMNLNLDLGLRRPGSAAALYYQGEKVSARFLGADWRPGVVARVRGEGAAKGSGGASYDVLFAHGALEVCIPPARLSKQLNLKEEVNEAIEEPGGGGQEGDPPPPTVTTTNNWADLPPADPREFEIFWDPAEGPLFFELAAYKTGGGVVATKVDLRDPRVQATRLDGGARLTAVTAAAATEGGGGDEDAGAAGGGEEAGAAGDGRTAAAAAEFKLEELKAQIAAASKPMGFRFREGPPVYRADRVAAARAAARRRPPLHVATFLPQRRAAAAAAAALDSSDSATPKGAKPLVFNFGFGAGTPNIEYEDIFEVSQRAMDFLESFHEHGISTELVNIETVTLPEPRNQGGGGGGGLLLGGGGGGGRLVQAARLWWRFPEATTVAVARTDEETAAQAPFGLVPHRTGEDGGFLCCRASPGSAMARAGVPVDRTLLLTHVNGYDVCPIAYRSIAPKQDSSGINSWAETVVPLFMECKNECTVTFI